MNKKLKLFEEDVIKSLQENLEGCTAIKGAEQHARQGAEQFKRMQEKYQNVRELLEQKLSSGELAFGRFIGAAEQVYLSTLDNLKQAVTIMRSAGSIDPVYINERLKHLEVNQNIQILHILYLELLLKK